MNWCNKQNSTERLAPLGGDDPIALIEMPTLLTRLLAAKTNANDALALGPASVIQITSPSSTRAPCEEGVSTWQKSCKKR